MGAFALVEDIRRRFGESALKARAASAPRSGVPILDALLRDTRAH